LIKYGNIHVKKVNVTWRVQEERGGMFNLGEGLIISQIS